MLFKGFFSVFSSGSYFVQWSRTILAIWVEGHPGIFLRNYFEIGSLASELMSFKDFSIFSSGGHFVQPSRTILAILVQGNPRTFLRNYFEIRPMAQKEKAFTALSIFSSGGYFVQQSGTIFAVWVESPKEHFCKIILKSGHWPRRRYCFRVFFLFLPMAAILLSGAEQF